MKTYVMTFKGRKLGAIGITSWHSIKQLAYNTDQAKRLLHQKYEHVMNLSIMELDEIDEKQKR